MDAPPSVVEHARDERAPSQPRVYSAHSELHQDRYLLIPQTCRSAEHLTAVRDESILLLCILSMKKYVSYGEASSGEGASPFDGQIHDTPTNRSISQTR